MPTNPDVDAPGIDDIDETLPLEDVDVTAALATVLDAIVKSARDRRKEQDGYKLLFASFSDGGMARAIFDAERQMSAIAMDLMQVIQDATGKKTDNELFTVMLGLPLALSLVRKDIEQSEGMSCCADKARLVLKTFFYDRLEMEVPVVPFQD